MTRDQDRPAPRPGVLDIAPYVPGRSHAPGGAKLYKLSSNETPWGPSPAAVAAYKQAGDALSLYPDESVFSNWQSGRAGRIPVVWG